MQPFSFWQRFFLGALPKLFFVLTALLAFGGLLSALFLAGPKVCLAGGAAPAVAAGGSHSVFLHEDGTVWCWGSNAYGQLGSGEGPARAAPRRVEGLSGIVAVAAGENHTLALREDGAVFAWGRNNNGQLGNNTLVPASLPVQVAAPVGGYLTGVTAIAAGREHSVALKDDGTVLAWGANLYGQLGDGTGSRRLLPVPTLLSLAPEAVPLAGIKAVAAGYFHTVALKDDGAVLTWGAGAGGRLGDGTTANRFLPVQVIDGGVAQVAAGGAHTLALRENGTVLAWGVNTYGQLGDATFGSRTTPVSVVLLEGVAGLGAGEDHSLAFKAEGTAWAWGRNSSGQLGDGTTNNRTARVQVVGPAGGGPFLLDIVALSGGSLHTLALQGEGVLLAWGENSSGQLGDGTFSSRSVPVQVQLPSPPAVRGTVPEDGAAAVSVGVEVTVTFGEAVRPGETFSEIVWRDDAGSAVEADMSIEGNTLFLRSREALAPAAAYTVRVPRWAVQGLPGNLLAADLVFSFTTEAAAGTPPLDPDPHPGPEPDPDPEPDPAPGSGADPGPVFGPDPDVDSDAGAAPGGFSPGTAAAGGGAAPLFPPWLAPLASELYLLEVYGVREALPGAPGGPAAPAAAPAAPPLRLRAALDAATLEEAAGRARQAGKKALALVIAAPAPAQHQAAGEPSLVEVELHILPGGSRLRHLSRLELYLVTPLLALHFPPGSPGAFVETAGAGELSFRFAPLKDAREQAALEVLFAAAVPYGGRLAAAPLQVETAFSGPVRVIVPLAPAASPERLRLFVRRSEGETALPATELLHGAKGAAALAAQVDRFSVFALFAVPYAKVLRFAPGSAAVFLNGRETALEAAPYIRQETGRMMVPLRSVAAKLGATVVYLPQERKIGIKTGAGALTLQVGSQRAELNGREVLLPCPVVLEGGRAFVPLRALGEFPGLELNWDSREGRAELRKRWDH